MFYTLFPKTILKAGVGLYSQGPQPQDLIPSLFGNPNLTYQRSFQYSIGVDQKLPNDWDLGLTLYDKYMWQLEAMSRLTDPMGNPLYLSNGGKGRSYGLELLVRRQFMKGFYGWIAYTLSRSTRLDDPSEPTYQYGWHLYDFDQTHILTLIASYQTEHNWTFGTRIRYVSGDPFTPFVNGIFNANNGQLRLHPRQPGHRDARRRSSRATCASTGAGSTTSGPSRATWTCRTSPTARTRRPSSPTTTARGTRP